VYVNAGYPAYYATDYSAGYSYPAVAYDTSSSVTPLPAPQAAELAPVPRPTDGYRYDGGPAQPVPPAAAPGRVPMAPPRPATPVRPTTPPVPTVINTVARQSSGPKLEYPAYGEDVAPAKLGRSNLVVRVAP
jgi:hypothetical protein